jgi:hypothetical protein
MLGSSFSSSRLAFFFMSLNHLLSNLAIPCSYDSDGAVHSKKSKRFFFLSALDFFEAALFFPVLRLAGFDWRLVVSAPVNFLLKLKSG